MSDSFATPWTIACLVPLSTGFPMQEYWSGLLFPSLGDLSDPGIEPSSPALAGGFFTTEPPGKPNVYKNNTWLPGRQSHKDEYKIIHRSTARDNTLSHRCISIQSLKKTCPIHCFVVMFFSNQYVVMFFHIIKRFLNTWFFIEVSSLLKYLV